MAVRPVWHSEYSMAKKVTAALLLLVVGAWAQFALAPMFTMLAGYGRSAHGPAQPGSHPAATALPHSCCPGFQKAETAVPAIVFASASLPCGEDHRCCFGRAPQSAPAPPRDDPKTSFGIQVTRVATVQLTPPAIRETARLKVFAPSPPATFGMTLRI